MKLHHSFNWEKQKPALLAILFSHFGELILLEGQQRQEYNWANAMFLSSDYTSSYLIFE